MLYKDLVDIYEKLVSSSKRLEKTYYLSKLIKKTNNEELPIILKLIQGKIFPEWEESKLGVAARTVLKSISTTTGVSSQKLEAKWKDTGDLGDVASIFTKNKIQSTLFSDDLTIQKVYKNLIKISSLSGPGTIDYKVKLISELLSSASPGEAKFLTRTVLEELRVGVGEGIIRDAIAWSVFPKIKGVFLQCEKCSTINPNVKHCFECGGDLKELENTVKVSIKNIDQLDYTTRTISAENEDETRAIYDYLINKIQHAFDIKNDFGAVAIAARIGVEELDKFELLPGSPIKVMLAQKVLELKDGFEKVGTPCALEYKYDGFRLQCHKNENKYSLYTRRLENVTKQFPDVVKYLKENVNAHSFILDAEAVGFNPKTTQYLPFQYISQRIKRKYDTEKVAKEIPVELNVFDIMYLNGKSMIDEPFAKRREALSKTISIHERKIVLSRIIVTDNEEEGINFYNKSLDSGNEGIMLKNLNSHYKPGSRVGFMIKLKPVMESLDLVITSASWGEGKRATWLTSFGVSCIDENGEFKEIGKVGTGIKELKEEGVTFNELTESLKPLITLEKGQEVRVKPEIVIEVNYEEIQKSKNYNSGYALRFPRLKTLRPERSPQDISNMDFIEELFYNQNKR